MSAGPTYRPYRTAAAQFQIGLRPMAGRQWLDISAGYGAFMPQKRARLAAEPRRYYRSLPGSLPAQAELLARAADHLLRDHGAAFARDGDRLACRVDGVVHDLAAVDEPLAILSRFIEEDFVILDAGEGGAKITAAANACSSSGRIVATVGADMPFAHGPVPGLNEQLGPRIDRILGNVKEGVGAERFNWMLTAIGDLLFPPESHAANAAASAAVARTLAEDATRCGDLLWIRMERQTLVRLPSSGALAFSFHTYSDPLSTIAEDRESLEGMAASLASYSAERLGYSSMTALRDPVLRWIEKRLAA